MISFVREAVAVKKNGEFAADFLHPLLDGWKRSEGNDEDVGIELFKFFLAGAQLCGMFTTRYSAKMTKKDEQNVIAVFQDFIKSNLFAVSGWKDKVWCGSVGFECHVLRCQISQY